MAPVRKKKKGKTWQVHLVLVICVILAAAFSSLALILAIGMVPTFVCLIVDKSKGRVKTFTVGALNFAGCLPFLLEIWKRGASLEMALNYILQPRTIVVMYFAAAMGYMIDWAMTGIVSSVMVQRGKARLKEIEKQKAALVERWGEEVTGNVLLDEYGFPKESTVPAEAAEGRSAG